MDSSEIAREEGSAAAEDEGEGNWRSDFVVAIMVVERRWVRRPSVDINVARLDAYNIFERTCHQPISFSFKGIVGGESTLVVSGT